MPSASVREALRRALFSLPDRPVVVLGPTGSGRSHLLECIAGSHRDSLRLRGSRTMAGVPWGSLAALGLPTADGGAALPLSASRALLDRALSLLAVDDAHWVDPETIALLTQLAPGLPLVVTVDLDCPWPSGIADLVQRGAVVRPPEPTSGELAELVVLPREVVNAG